MSVVAGQLEAKNKKKKCNSRPREAKMQDICRVVSTHPFYAEKQPKFPNMMYALFIYKMKKRLKFANNCCVYT